MQEQFEQVLRFLREQGEEERQHASCRRSGPSHSRKKRRQRPHLAADADQIAGPVPLLGCFPHLPSDDASQPLIACQPEHIIHALAFAPAHQLVAAESGVAPQDDSHCRPCPSNLIDDSFDLHQASCRSIAVGLAKPCAQDMFTAEDVQRQVTVVIVVAVKEPTFLLPMQRQVGGVYVDNDLLRSLFVRLDKYTDQQLVYRSLPERDFLVPIRLPIAEFQPVQRALARQWFVQFFASSQHSKQRILSQLLVIVQVFIAERQSVDALGNHLQNRVLHPILFPSVEKAVREARQQIQPLIRLPQQQRASV